MEILRQVDIAYLSHHDNSKPTICSLLAAPSDSEPKGRFAPFAGQLQLLLALGLGLGIDARALVEGSVRPGIS